MKKLTSAPHPSASQGVGASEAATVNGNGGADNLNYEDRTGGTYGTVGAPAGGAVYKPTGPTSGTFNVAGGGVTNLTFVNIGGAFGVNGDPTNTGGRDVLTVLGFTTAGLATPFGEATSPDFFSTCHGAYLSGIAAVRQIAALKR